MGHLDEPALGGVRKEFHWVSNKLYVHNFLGFSTRLQPYTIYLGYLYLPPLMRPDEESSGSCLALACEWPWHLISGLNYLYGPGHWARRCFGAGLGACLRVA